jgi:hypothetical protein
MHITGQCHCGAIAYEAEIDPAKVVVCHCTDCQKLSGGPYRVVVPIAGTAVKFTKGQPKVYIKTAESGRKRQQAFCANCGSPFYAAPENAGPNDMYGFRIGTIDQRAQLAPKKQIWCQSALPYAMDIADLPQFAKAPT